MASTDEPRSRSGAEAEPAHAEAVAAQQRSAHPASGEQAARTDHHAAARIAANAPPPVENSHPPRWRRRLLLLGAGVVVVAAAAYFLVPWVVVMLNTVSTDDAYVNGHVTYVAPRVAGQVSRVLVDDNQQVKKGDLLVQLDKEPYQVQVEIKKAALAAAESGLVTAQAQVRALEALARSQRWKLQNAIEQVENQIASLDAQVAAYQSRQATLALARANLARGEQLIQNGGISKEELDQRRQAVKVAEAAVEQALQMIHATRVGLGLPAEPLKGHPLTEVPPELPQNFSGVRSALAQLVQTMAQIGLPLPSANATPKQVIEDFKKRDASGDIDRILESLVPHAPAVKQAEAKLLEARQDLAQAELNLSYCDVVAEIDGVVTRRNVNPGNNVQVGQALMAIRSVTEIWIDANFKETQLAYLRIGQPVKIEVDMYGAHREFAGRITGFTMGTGSTLALLPPENATGNFVKVVQRLPVRIELNDYDPVESPLFIGLSCVPYVYYKEPLIGNDPGKGQFLQPVASNLPTASTRTSPGAAPGPAARKEAGGARNGADVSFRRKGAVP